MPASSPSPPADLTVTAKAQLGVLSPWKRCQISFNSRSGTVQLDGQVITLRGSDVSHSRKGTSIISHTFSRPHMINNTSTTSTTSLLSNSPTSVHNVASSSSSARHHIVTLTPCSPTSRAAWKKFCVGLTLASRSPDGFRLLRELGSGASGVVYKAYISDQELRSKLDAENPNKNGIIALKMIPKVLIDDCTAEFNIAKLSIAKHKSLLVPLHIFLTKTHLVIAMPYILGGSLLEKMQATRGGVYGFSEKLIRKIIHDILSAIKVLHSKDLAHRDIKLENILVEGHNAYLCDLGLVAKVPKHGFIQSAGTKYIQAPEIGGISRYGKQCDMWSIGVVLLILLRKGIPFSDDTHRNHLLKQMRNSDDPLEALLSEKRRKTLPQTLLDLLRGLLSIDPSKRLTVGQALSHAYFTNIENEWPECDMDPEEIRKRNKRNKSSHHHSTPKNECDYGPLGKISFVTLAIIRLRFMRAINRMRRISNASSRASMSIEAAPRDRGDMGNYNNHHHDQYNYHGWRTSKRKCILQSAIKLISSLCASSCSEAVRTPPTGHTSFFGDCTSSGPPSPLRSPCPSPSPTASSPTSTNRNTNRRWSLSMHR